jgi:hypothetical protein
MCQNKLISLFHITPFGSAMATRGYAVTTKYRYGFNTQEKGDGITSVTPHKGFDGQVCLSSTRNWHELGDDGVTIVAKPITRSVYHELWENYERTHNDFPYDFPIYKSNGESILYFGLRFAKDPNRDGAHYKAIRAEDKFHNKSKRTGVTE